MSDTREHAESVIEITHPTDTLCEEVSAAIRTLETHRNRLQPATRAAVLCLMAQLELERDVLNDAVTRIKEAVAALDAVEK